MKNTENYGFNLPETTDIYNVEDFNENMKNIDEILGNTIQYPNYVNWSNVLSDTGSYTITKNGFVQFIGGNENDIPDVLYHTLNINGITVEQKVFSGVDYYDYVGAIYPVKKGDVVQIYQSSYEWCICRFYPLR